MAKKLPQTELDLVEPTDIQKTVASLIELSNMGKPKTDIEVIDRVDMFFDYCMRSQTRPGIESLCLVLHCSRQTLLNWQNGQGCSKVRQETIQQAKQLIASFIEQVTLSGKINPASGIFLMKNWLNYKDTLSFDERFKPETKGMALLAKDLPRIPESEVKEYGEGC